MKDVYEKILNHPAMTDPKWYYGDNTSKRKIKVGKKKPAGKGKKQKKYGRLK